MTTKPWSGRFEKETDPQVEAFTASIQVDQRLARHDIAGSVVHARMLGRQKIIPATEATAIVQGLAEVWQDIQAGAVQFSPAMEDIHMAVEALLAEKIGPVAGKLHTARSRNDQVALDIRLFTREAIAATVEAIRELQAVLVRLAEQHGHTIFPGYTHLQRAQPVLLAHHFLAYFEMLQRDQARFREAYARADVMPLGSGALAGVPYPLDRAWVAQQLGFSQVTTNSLDAVSDRDFLLEYQAAASICMLHLSRLAEEIVLWSTPEFGYIELDDAYATGSSIMPQKKNPDVAELVRGKTGQVFGHLLGLLTLLKGLPLSYNRDMQEDKPGFFATADTLLASLRVFAGMLATMKVNRTRAREAAGKGYALATDLADFLVRRGLPFREAHRCVGELVRYAASQDKQLHDLTLEEYQRHSSLFTSDDLGLTAEMSVAARNVLGGTAPGQVAAQIAAARRALEEARPLPAPDLDPRHLIDRTAS
ncbi:MAG: argininosuccinate lyase [Chloroflexi bacterium]|nr:argininosuccinate lyase [Chloroflexota bacterium]